MIELRDVHKSFGKVEVLKGITASVAKSEVVCIIGPSGSGKSTILRCINGLESYDRGEISVEGARVDSNDRSIVAIRTQVSMVFQRFNLFPHRTALENVIEGPLYVKKEPREQAIARGRALLAQVGLADKAEVHPPKLSGGQQQRVAIARALATRPNYMLLDEPFAGIDPIAVGDIQDLVRHLTNRGIGVLITDHNVRETLGLTDRAYIVYAGEILTEGSPEEIVNDPDVRRLYLGEEFRL